MLPSLFILVTALLNLLGWGLSLFSALTPVPYALALTAGLIGVGWWFSQTEGPITQARQHRIANRLLWRATRFLPLSFFLLAAIALASGLLFAPDHNDALSFRLPRILHWLDAHGWQWIGTSDPRMNIRGAGFELSALPFLLFTGSNRLIFLVNFAGYLCLPGLTYGTYRRLGVAPRVAWNWMWILPSAYAMILGASNAGNDLLLVVYTLAALFFALRGVERSNWSDLALSIFALALLTSTKQTTLPLLLPWLVALAPGWRVLWRHKAKTLAVGVVALAISVAFLSWANWQHTGDWSGLITDRAVKAHTNPLLNLTGNTALIVLQNLTPPLFPWRDAWLQWAHAWQQTPLGQLYAANFETSFLWLPIRLSATFATLGPGVFGLLVMAGAAALFGCKTPTRRLSKYQTAILIAVVASSLVILLKTAMWQIGRHFLPYAVCLIPFLLASGAQSALVRRRWWRGLVALQWVHVLLAVLLIAQRSPLAVRRDLQSFYISKAVQTAKTDAWVRQQIPTAAHTIGVIRSDIDSELWLWQPVGSRRVVTLAPDVDAATLERLGIHYIVISELALEERSLTLAQWLWDHEAQPVAVISEDYHPWYLVERIKVDKPAPVRE